LGGGVGRHVQSKKPGWWKTAHLAVVKGANERLITHRNNNWEGGN